MLTQVLTLLRRSVGLTTLAATLNWALLVDALWNFLVDKPLHREKMSSIEGGCWRRTPMFPTENLPIYYHFTISWAIQHCGLPFQYLRILYKYIYIYIYIYYICIYIYVYMYIYICIYIYVYIYVYTYMFVYIIYIYIYIYNMM